MNKKNSPIGINKLDLQVQWLENLSGIKIAICAIEDKINELVDVLNQNTISVEKTGEDLNPDHIVDTNEKIDHIADARKKVEPLDRGMDWDKLFKDSFKKKDWTMDQWKNSEDVIDRTVWLTQTLSPHNLWKADQAIRNEIAQARQQERKATLEEVVGKLEGMGYHDECTDYCRGCKDANDHAIKTIAQLSGREK